MEYIAVSDKRFGAAWDSYAKMIPADAHPVQIQETRRAFYAGGGALFHALMSSLTSDTEPIFGLQLLLDELKAEFDDWVSEKTLDP